MMSVRERYRRTTQTFSREILLGRLQTRCALLPPTLHFFATTYLLPSPRRLGSAKLNPVAANYIPAIEEYALD